MKKIKLILTILVVSSCSLFAQVKSDTVTVVKIVDDMTNKSFITPSKRLIIANEEKTKGFSLDIVFGSTITLLSKTVGLSGCNEKDELIILLSDSSKIKLKSWKDFNCKGEGYFTLSSSTIEKLRSSEISKIRITNGRSYDSYTGEVPVENKRYFIQLFNSYYSNNYKIVKDDE